MRIQISKSNIIDDSIIDKCISVNTNLHIHLYTFGSIDDLNILGNIIFFDNIKC